MASNRPEKLKFQPRGPDVTQLASSLTNSTTLGRRFGREVAGFWWAGGLGAWFFDTMARIYALAARASGSRAIFAVGVSPSRRRLAGQRLDGHWKVQRSFEIKVAD